MKMRLLKLLQKGLLTEGQVKQAVVKGLITEKDFNEIKSMLDAAQAIKA